MYSLFAFSASLLLLSILLLDVCILEAGISGVLLQAESNNRDNNNERCISVLRYKIVGLHYKAVHLKPREKK
ncbi:MAG: hypothetical protein Q9M39_05585, partial [Sulfurovum sp.]|nr:hypothetical protein [Sulfurovum sp.]